MLRKSATIAGLAAALSMTVTPAAAAEMPHASSLPAQVETGAPQDANNHRYGYRRYRNRSGIGDVIAGVAIIGTIAAIANAARGDRYRDRYDPRYRDRDYRYDRRGEYDRRERYDSSGMDRAADMCVAEVERGRERVDDIDNATRGTDGWRVSGTLENGGGWDCWIDNDGRIRDVNFGGAYSARSSDGGYYADMGKAGQQWSADAYARARAATRTAADGEYAYRTEPAYDVQQDSGPQPAYPGGPLPGEEGYGDAAATDDGGWEGDGRYSTAQAPDFTT